MLVCIGGARDISRIHHHFRRKDGKNVVDEMAEVVVAPLVIASAHMYIRYVHEHKRLFHRTNKRVLKLGTQAIQLLRLL